MGRGTRAWKWMCSAVLAGAPSGLLAVGSSVGTALQRTAQQRGCLLLCCAAQRCILLCCAALRPRLSSCALLCCISAPTHGGSALWLRHTHSAGTVLCAPHQQLQQALLIGPLPTPHHHHHHHHPAWHSSHHQPGCMLTRLMCALPPCRRAAQQRETSPLQSPTSAALACRCCEMPRSGRRPPSGAVRGRQHRAAPAAAPACWARPRRPPPSPLGRLPCC